MTVHIILSNGVEPSASIIDLSANPFYFVDKSSGLTFATFGASFVII